MTTDHRVLKQQVVDACHILASRGLASTFFGNISIRIPGTNEYFQNPANVFFENVGIEDVVRVDTEGRKLEGSREPHQGDCIHRMIFRKRPDVHAIAHTHAPAMVLMSALGECIKPFTQIGAAFYKDQALYSDFTGPVRDVSEGEAIADALGQNSIVIAKNHGIFSARSNIKEATWDLVLIDLAAREHLEFLKMGITEPPPLGEAEFWKSKSELRMRMPERAWENLLNS